MSLPIYLDYNGTTPLHPAVKTAISGMLDLQGPSISFGNPSSTHYFGLKAKDTLFKAREHVSSLLDCSLREVIFTSGGTESNNMAIIGCVLHYVHQNRNSLQYTPPHIVSSMYEHPAVAEVLDYCATYFGVEVTRLPVNDLGCLADMAALRDAIKDNTILVSIILANNEIGTLNNIQKIATTAKNIRPSILVHTDASQAVGKIRISFKALKCDLLTVAAHKFYGPKGVGALVVKSGVEKLMKCALYGAGQERGMRPGTENVMYIAALGACCKAAIEEISDRIVESARFIDIFYTRLHPLVRQGHIRINGAIGSVLDKLHQSDDTFEAYVQLHDGPLSYLASVGCLPNTLSISVRGVQANTIISEVDQFMCISAGAACHSDIVELSDTLKAIQLDMEYAMGTVRISFGRELTIEDIERAADHFVAVVSRLSGRELTTVEIHRQNRSLSQEPVAKAQVIEVPRVAAASSTVVCPFVAPAEASVRVNMMSYTQGLGCACKLRPLALERIMARLDMGSLLRSARNLIVGPETADDAAVYDVNGNLLVSTVDFFSPVIDDPYKYGEASAANALSDIYAMGGRALYCLAVVGFPTMRLHEDVLVSIMQGATSKCKEAGVVIAGGHTIDSTEPFFGLCVNGIVESKNLRRNTVGLEVAVNNSEDDKVFLLLTKRLGTGMLTTALKRNIISRDKDVEVYDDLCSSISTLNLYVLDELEKSGCMDSIVALTDVTGFGLAGHLSEMLQPNHLAAELHFQSLPIFTKNGFGASFALKRLHDGYKDAIVSGGLVNNREWLMNRGYMPKIVAHDSSEDMTSFASDIVCDPQTSGGLLLAVKGRESCDQIAAALQSNPNIPVSAVIGTAGTLDSFGFEGIHLIVR